MSEKKVKMTNKFGNSFECLESEVERYLKAGATIDEPKKEVKKDK